MVGDELSEVQLGLLLWSLVVLGISPGEAWMDTACGASERMLCRADELRNQANELRNQASSGPEDGTGPLLEPLESPGTSGRQGVAAGGPGTSGRQGVAAGGPGTLYLYPKQVLREHFSLPVELMSLPNVTFPRVLFTVLMTWSHITPPLRVSSPCAGPWPSFSTKCQSLGRWPFSGRCTASMARQVCHT